MFWAVLGGAAFVPPVIFLLVMRRDELHHREPIRALLSSFLYGATLGVTIALFLNILFDVGFPTGDAAWGLDKVFFATIVAAPFIEEFAKGMGMGLARPRLRELEDGIIYGAAIGLGFAATENFVYGIDAWAEDGLRASLVTIGVRIFSSVLLHAGSTALLGFGYGIVRRRHGVVIEMLPYYLVAVLLHAVYNFLVAYQEWYGLGLAVVMVALVWQMMRRRIRALDALPHLS